MPWKEETVEEQRRTFVALASEAGCNFSALCREFQITRRTGYKWLERYRAGGSLADESRAPRYRPGKTCAGTEELILSVRSDHPTWGARKILRYLADKGNAGLPAPSTAAAILKRNGFVSPEESARHTAFLRFERAAPNELWQMDILPIHGRPLHPQTQGKEERPHGALGLDVPARHYKRSARQMPAVLREPEYASGKTLRKVNCKGYISVRQHRYYLSETFSGRYMELLPQDENVVAVCYGDFIVAKIDLDEQLFLSRRIARR